MFVSLAFLSLFLDGYLLYVAGVLAVLAGLGEFVSRILANRRHALGLSIKRVAMLALAYKMNCEDFDVAYLLSKVPSSIHSRIAKRVDDTGESNTYVIPDESDRLRWMIQENAYFNTALYHACADKAFRVIVVTPVFALLPLLFLIPLADNGIQNLIMRAFLLMFSFTFVHDQVLAWTNWRMASKVMLDLENELARMRVVPAHRTLLIFSSYQVVISTAQSIPVKVYAENQAKLNDGWRHRVATLQREWSDVPA